MSRSKSIFRRCVSGVIVVVLSTAAWGDGDEQYKIKLTRPDKVGDEFIATVNVKLDRAVDANINGQAQPQKADGFTAELHGIVKVLAVNEKSGEATKVTVKVDKLTQDGNELYAAGTVITAEKVDHKAVFTIDGDKVNDANAEVLGTLIDPGDPVRTTNDDALTGTDQPQKTGASWPVNADNLAKDLGEHEMTVKGANIKGDTKLTEVKKVDGTEVMVIDTDISAEGVRWKSPDGVQTSTGSLSAKVTDVLPTDPAGHELQQTSDVQMKINMTFQGGLGKAVVNSECVTKKQRDAVKE